MSACGLLNFIADTMNAFPMFKLNVWLKTLLREGLSEPEFYGDLVYKFKKLIREGMIFLFNSINHYALQTYIT